MRNKTKDQCGRRGERIFSNACVFPSLIGVMIFFFVPFCIVIYYSLINNPVLKEFVGLENYTKLFSNSAFTKAAKNTAFFSLVSVPLSVILSLVGMCGDLTASVVKRNFGVKDFGNILPGHGGVMDRFDSGLFVLSMLYAIITITGNVL